MYLVQQGVSAMQLHTSHLVGEIRRMVGLCCHFHKVWGSQGNKFYESCGEVKWCSSHPLGSKNHSKPETAGTTHCRRCSIQLVIFIWTPIAALPPPHGISHLLTITNDFFCKSHAIGDLKTQPRHHVICSTSKLRTGRIGIPPRRLSFLTRMRIGMLQLGCGACLEIMVYICPRSE
jgi:hypothetical protein